MQIPPETVDRMLPMLRRSEHFQTLPATNRPMKAVWTALDQTLLGLRLPLYNQRLGKRPAAQKDLDAVIIPRAMVLLGAFAVALGVHQAIVTTANGYLRSISFQPRPFGMNWTAEHAIDPVAFTRTSPSEPGAVTVDDMLFLAAKIVHVVSGQNMGKMADSTSTFSFDAVTEPPSIPMVFLTVRELSGKRHYAVS